MTTTNTANGPQDHVAYRMETSRDLLDWLGGQFARRTRPRAGNGKDSTGQASSPADGAKARTIGRLELQVARVCELVNLALAQVDLYGDLGMAWILLEQARQQLGHAAVSAAAGSSSDGGEGEAGGHAAMRAQIVWLLQCDRMPWPQDAAEVIDFGGGPGLLPDLLPDTPLELQPLQLLAHASMTLAAGIETQGMSETVMVMAFGEYVSTIMAEAMELLSSCSDPEDVDEIVETGHQVADLIAGAFPPAWQMFQGPAGFPGEAA
ncbi:hypothetical protein DQ226_08650 [Dietzia maris]|uniref:Uncharacterized protein n=1 Tax=Dietzia maris TaxID=37915 RepID=A0A365PAD3_9ACTN|nr:hypothetical protein DQ226_08650 [Dietzia maris]